MEKSNLLKEIDRNEKQRLKELSYIKLGKEQKFGAYDNTCWTRRTLSNCHERSNMFGRMWRRK